MVGAFELVLDEHPGVRRRVFAEQVGPEWSDVLLLCLELQLDADGFPDEREVLVPGEPRREVPRLAELDIPEVDPLKASQAHFVDHEAFSVSRTRILPGRSLGSSEARVAARMRCCSALLLELRTAFLRSKPSPFPPAMENPLSPLCPD